MTEKTALLRLRTKLSLRFWMSGLVPKLPGVLHRCCINHAPGHGNIQRANSCTANPAGHNFVFFSVCK